MMSIEALYLFYINVSYIKSFYMYEFSLYEIGLYKIAVSDIYMKIHLISFIGRLTKVVQYK